MATLQWMTGSILRSRVGLALTGILLLVGVGWFVYASMQASAQYDEVLASYRDASNREMQAALIPGVKDNPVRRELDRTLAEVLAREMSDDERLKLAQHGLEVLVVAEEQIDSIGEAGAAASHAREQLRQHSLGSSFSFSGSSYELIELAKQRSDIISDIRGLSYRANYHTEDIFKKVVADGGSLTRAHITSLNDLIPKVEEQFNERSNLYFELESVNNRMETLIADL